MAPIIPPVPQDLLISYVGLLSLATCIIVAGSFAALKVSPLKKIHKKPKLIPDSDDEEYTDDEDEEFHDDAMQSADAILYPITGSIMLFGLWWLIRKVGVELVNELLATMFAMFGIGSVFKLLTGTSRLVTHALGIRMAPKYKIVFTSGIRELFAVRFPHINLMLLPMSFAPTLAYILTPKNQPKPVLWTVVLGSAFAFHALSMIKLDSFKTGVILLSGLFVYDVWWVFGTTVMVDVATKLDVPIKLMWPKNSNGDFTLLGLGDVVVPGMFIALALRYDQHRFVERAGGKGQSKQRYSFGKPYFWAAISAYILGLATTTIVMHITKRAQPALLYLSPACILSFLLTAAIRGEMAEAWAWTTTKQKTSADIERPIAKPITEVVEVPKPTSVNENKPAPDQSWLEVPNAANGAGSGTSDAEDEAEGNEGGTPKARKRNKKRR
ncbi:hypothetical protein FRC03_012209 [Tulasnella sp. 419]|nr:hypothetical protein FRC03_012209 [Tulasnella sp. 419]